MLDPVDLAMHQPLGPDNTSAEDLPDRLMAETDAEDRHPPGKAADGIGGDPRLVGRAGAGGDDEMARGEGGYCVAIDLVVAVDLDRHAGGYLADPLDEIPGEGVVVVDEENHRLHPSSSEGCPSRSTSGRTCGL